MKKSAILFLFVIFLFSGKGQNYAWFPIHPNTNYNFVIDSSNAPVAAVIKVDSVLGGSYYLNKIVLPCDTCNNQQLVNDAFDSTYVLDGQPQFLQQLFVKTINNGFYFIGKRKFVIYPFMPTGSSWVYDTLNNITATIVSKNIITLFSLPDSICTIKLSSNDTLQISKNSGIILYPYKTLITHRFHLVGKEGLTNAGNKLKHFHDFFDFSVGDVIQYSFSDYDFNILPPMFKDGHERWDVLNASIYNDSVCYSIRKTYFDSVKYGSSTPVITAYTNTIYVSFTDSSKHLANLYPFESILVNPYFIYNNGIQHIHKVMVGLENSLNTKSFGLSCPSVYLNGGVTGAAMKTQFNNLYLNKNSVKIVGRKLTEGLGFTSELYNDYDRILQRCVIGYVKGSDTIGTINAIPLALKENSNYNEISIYPNPANERLTINGKFYTGATITILNSMGITVYEKKYDAVVSGLVLGTEDLLNGIYFIVITTPDHKVVKKFVVAN